MKPCCIDVPQLFQVRRLIESLIFGEAVHDSRVISAHLRHPSGSRGIASADRSEQCVCEPCQDIISRAHSSRFADFRRHDKNFVHHWLTDALDNHPARTPRREINLTGYSDIYLENLEKEWINDEKRLDRRQ
jgi:hypothetical protein